MLEFQVSQMIKKRGLVYSSIASLEVLVQHFHRLQQAKMERVSAYVNQLERALNGIQ